MTVNKALLTLVTLLLGGCNGMQIEDFRQTQPEFILEDYFQGNTRAWGLFEDRFGNIQRQFVVDINGTWDGSTLVLNEDFIYNDGAGENRVWSVTKTGDKTYQGTTEHVVGAAVGTREGNAFNWNYEFNLKVGDDVWKVRFDDWMFLQPNGVLLNTATVTRWGIKLGTVFLSFSKPAIPQAAAESS
ncbi:MAG TPA: DUF3833 domain-containing protein [Gammaproteobacteria bacterium]|nr:DUF3833 domain-containing protein [Gammaproteobacteria bacterium]